MKTAEEYAKLAEHWLQNTANLKNETEYERRQAVLEAQLIATLAQAAATAEQTQWWQRRDEQMGLGTATERSLSAG